MSDHRHDHCIEAARASIVYVQRTHGSGETRKIHSVNQRLCAFKEDEAMKLGGIQVPMQSPSMSGKEPVE